MNINEKMKAALTVAAIAGTCALSSPSFAAWTSDAPNKLATNITAGAVDTTRSEGMVIVGSEGKLYRMSTSSMKGSDPQWSKRAIPVAGDFADIVYETTTSGFYWAVTETGELVQSSDSAAWNTVEIADPAKSAIAGKKVVGITACGDGEGDSDIVITTADGVVVYFDQSASSWNVTAADLAGENIATAGITGIKALTGEDGKVVVFGKGGGNGNANNVYTVTIGSDTVVGFNVENCPNINDMAIHTKSSWYAVGDTAAVVKGAQDLSGATANIGVAKLDLKQADGTTAYTGTADLLSVEYNNSSNLGYISGAEGTLFRLSDTTAVAKSSGTTEDLNDVNLVFSGAIKRAFASGNNGASMYGSEECWSDISSVTGLPGSGTPSPRALISKGSVFYMIDGTTNKLYSSSSPNSAWTEASLAPANGATPNMAARVVIGTTSGGDTYVAQYSSSMDGRSVITYKAGDTTNAPGTSDLGQETPHFAVANFNGEPVLFKARGASFAARDLASTSGIFMGAGTGLTGEIQSLAASTNGLYAVDKATKTTVYARVQSPGNTETLDLSKSEVGPGWTAVSVITTYLADNGNVTADKLFPVTGGVVLVTSDGKLHLITDQADADVTSNEIQIKALDCPATDVDAASKVRDVSGSATNMAVAFNPGGATDPEVWHYTEGGSWERYEDVENSLGISDIAGIAASGTKIAIYDYDELGYSTGNSYTTAVPDGALPVGTKISSVFNATKSEIYVGGQDGLLYNGTLKEGASSIAWKEKRYNDSFFGSYDLTKITGAGDKVFAAYGSFGSDLAWKDLTATEWTQLSKSSGSVGTINDMQAIDSSIIYFASASNGFVKGTVDSGSNQIAYTQQSVSGAGSIPGSLAALSAIDSDTVYAIATSKLYKLSSPSGDQWTLDIINITNTETLNDIVAVSSDEIYAVGDNGYAVKYDGSSATNLPAITGTPKLTSCWAQKGFLYTTDDAGKVHTYNANTNGWTTETVRSGVELADISGSAKGEYLLAVGADSTSYLNEISGGSDSEDGGGSKDSSVSPNTDDSAVVSSETPVKRTPDVLAKTYGTPSDMAVVSEVQQFTTTGGVTSGSTHTFTFNFTPTENYDFNNVILYKLKAAGDNLTYRRLGAAPATPASGDFWITTSTGGAVGPGDTLVSGTTYAVYFALADGSPYDDDNVDGKITDPAVLGTISSGGSSGCVFNPAQTLGLEWLMLAFAPVAAFFRSRFK